MDGGLLNISMVQSDIVYENRAANLKHFGALLRDASPRADIAVLPELFTTGMSMRVEDLSETVEGETIATVKQWAGQYRLAIAGSFMALDGANHYNRAFFITPDGKEYYCDKRHLFRMAGEDAYFDAGDKRLIIRYGDWRICLMVCYDLRFPVWSRNVDNEYDVLIYVANWAEARKEVWKTLLRARAIENMAYVVGVNRIGTDGAGYRYHGESLVYSPKGEELFNGGEHQETIQSCLLEKKALESFRTKFPVWKDADRFSIQP
ncbi:MAG: amidohydrolase [Tannerella sp.]|jgi:predicted amidohydrolase|nr:amidohydrolase [Tannerella sp.]